MRLLSRALLLLVFTLPLLVSAQQSASPGPDAHAAAPPLVKVNGMVKDAHGAIGVTFALYKDQTGGAPLWLETQSVTVDANGRFTAILGANHAHGLPVELFASGEVRWLGVQPDGQSEQPRTLQVSVPYALQSANADRLGGLPLAAFTLNPRYKADPNDLLASTASDYLSSTAAAQAASAISGAAVGYLPMFTSTAGDMTSSGIYQNTNGTVGINTATPASMFHIVSPLPGVATFQRSGGARFTFQNDTDAGGTGVIFYVTDNGGGNYKPLSFDASSLRFRANGSDTNVLFVDPLGRVGMGTTAPAARLEVKGDLKLSAGSGGGVVFADATRQTTAGVAHVSATPGSGITASTDANFAVTLSADTTVLQKRVGTPCAAGSAISGINADGSVNCQTVGGGGGLVPPISISGAGTPPNYVFAATETASGPQPPQSTPLTLSFMQSVPAAVVGYGNAGSGVGAGVAGFGLGSGGYSVGVAAVASGSAPALVAFNSNTTSGGGIESENSGVGDAAIKAKAYNSSGTALGLSVPYGSSATLIDGQSSGFRVDGTGAVQAMSMTVGQISTFNNCNTPPCQLGVNSTVNLNGDLHVFGTMSAINKQFKIDHPLDPANKYLSHASIESSDMMNLYNGIVRLDARGQAWVTLPDWFEALNGDFRYQLTSIGRSQPGLFIARGVSNHRFKIAGGAPRAQVSWQVTGVRHDAYANANRTRVEQEKTGDERGRYLYPEGFGQSAEKGIQAIKQPVAAPQSAAPQPALEAAQ